MSNDRVSVSLKIDDRHVTLEGPRDFVEAEVRRLTDALAPKPRIESLPDASSGRSSVSAVGALSERDFVTRKSPSGHMEIVAVLAFYLSEQGQEEFSDEDIRRAYIRAGVRPPKVVAQALRDAKNKKDFIEQGSTRGSYRLTHHGDRFVRFDLDGGQSPLSGTEPLQPNHPTTSRPRKKKIAKRDNETPKKRSSGTRPGPRIALNQLVSEEYFDSPRRMADIQGHLAHSKAHTYKTSDLSPTLVRMLRDEVLTRTRADDGQYEYKRK